MESRRIEYDKITYYKLDERKRGEILQKLRSLLAGDDRVALAYVFGSFTRRASVRDVDVAVYAAPPLSFDELLDLGAKIELELGIPVDLVQLSDLSPKFRYKLLRHGLPVVEKHRHLKYSLMDQALSEFDDLVALRKLPAKV